MSTAPKSSMIASLYRFWRSRRWTTSWWSASSPMRSIWLSALCSAASATACSRRIEMSRTVVYSRLAASSWATARFAWAYASASANERATVSEERRVLVTPMRLSAASASRMTATPAGATRRSRAALGRQPLSDALLTDSMVASQSGQGVGVYGAERLRMRHRPAAGADHRF